MHPGKYELIEVASDSSQGEAREWDIRKDGQSIGCTFDPDLFTVNIEQVAKEWLDDHVVKACRSESIRSVVCVTEERRSLDSRINHVILGIVTELGEFADPFKKYLYYGAQTDLRNAKEELGDILWYVCIACDALGISLYDVLLGNRRKLLERYKKKFTAEEALTRNIDAEMKALDGLIGV